MRYGIDIIIRDDKNFISLSEINEIEEEENDNEIN